jgi:hypothetical protein
MPALRLEMRIVKEVLRLIQTGLSRRQIRIHPLDICLRLTL